jgi:hypothetical protein
MSSVSIAGDTSGSILLAAPAVAGSSTLTLPTTGGTVLATTTPGAIIQTVSASYYQPFTTTSSTYVSTGNSATITPKSATSKIAIFVSSTMGSSNFGSGYGTAATIYRGSTNLALGSGTVGFTAGYIASTGSGGCMPVAINYVDSPATTSATTYTIYVLASLGAANVSWNSSNNIFNYSTGTIILMEIAV